MMAQIDWTGAIDGKFSNAADWTGGVVPGASDTANLPDWDAPYTVVAATSETVAAIDTGAGARLQITGGTFTASTGTGAGVSSGAILVEDGASFAIGGAVVNQGVIDLVSYGDATSLVIASDTTLSGDGAVTLSDEAGNHIIATNGASVTLTNADDTISGGGVIGGSGLTLDNELFGVIDADGMQGITIGSATGSGSLVNAGLIEATAIRGGALAIQNMTITGAGELFAGSYSVLTLTDCVVAGQSLKTAPESQIDLMGTNTVTLTGSLYNAGDIEDYGASSLIVSGKVTLSGGGGLALGGAILEGASGASLLTVSDNTVYGSGQLGAGQLRLVVGRKGVIEESGGLVVDTGRNTIANRGTIEAFGGVLTVQSAIDNTGTLSADQGTLILNGAVSGAGEATIYFGTLEFGSASNQTVTFLKSSHTRPSSLELAQSQTFTGQVSGISNAYSKLDLFDIAYVNAGEATFSGTTASGVLTVTDGNHTAHITLIGDYLTTNFAASSDGSGGVDVVAQVDAPATTSPLWLIAAMATLRSDGGALVHTTGDTGLARAQPLSLPRPVLA